MDTNLTPATPTYASIVSPECVSCTWDRDGNGFAMSTVNTRCPLHGRGAPMNNCPPPVVTVVPVPADQPAALYLQYTGRVEVQRVFLQVDLDRDELSCEVDEEIGGGVPLAVFNRRWLRVTVPCLSAAAANALMQQVLPDVKQVVAGAAIEWDGNNWVGRLTQDADDAWTRVQALCGDENFHPEDTIVAYDASEWFDADAVTTLGITAATTDEELATIAAAQEQAATDTTPGWFVLRGVLEWLTAKRDEMRSETPS